MHFKLLAFLSLISASLVCEAQVQPRRGRAGGAGGMGGPPQPQFGGSMLKLFGENKAFTANLQMETKIEAGPMSVPGKMALLDGKSRFEMDATKIKGGGIPPGAAEQMKQMGMAEIINISRPDKNENYLIYPGLKAYAVMPAEKESATAAEKADMKKTELGKETVNGQATTKYKVEIKDGTVHESTIWSATDLKGFPIKIETTNEGIPSTMTFTDVKLEKPEESLFNPPADFQRYNDVGAMMRESMMKRFAPPGGIPPKG